MFLNVLQGSDSFKRKVEGKENVKKEGKEKCDVNRFLLTLYGLEVYTKFV